MYSMCVIMNTEITEFYLFYTAQTGSKKVSRCPEFQIPELLLEPDKNQISPIFSEL